MANAADRKELGLRATMNGKPVHTVPAKSVINMDSGFKHKLLCDGPTFTAGSACAYRCSFCYVEDLMQKNPHWHSVKAEDPKARFEDVVIRRSGAVAAMRDQLTDRHGKSKFTDPNDRRVIYASPLVDVAANMELVRETVEACKVILELTNWQIRLLSKSNLLPKVAEGIDKAALESAVGAPLSLAESWKRRVIYGVSTGTLDDKLAQAFEQGTALVSKRIASLHWLQDNGFRTFGMICPSLPQIHYEDFALQMCDAIRSSKCEHVWGEVLNARGESLTRTVRCLKDAGYDWEATALQRVSVDKTLWESYARKTFNAQTGILSGELGPDGTPKLRFLQYVTKDSKPWWASRVSDGAILL